MKIKMNKPVVIKQKNKKTIKHSPETQKMIDMTRQAYEKNRVNVSYTKEGKLDDIVGSHIPKPSDMVPVRAATEMIPMLEDSTFYEDQNFKIYMVPSVKMDFDRTRFIEDQFQYLAVWDKYHISRSSWIRASFFTENPEIINDFAEEKEYLHIFKSFFFKHAREILGKTKYRNIIDKYSKLSIEMKKKKYGKDIKFLISPDESEPTPKNPILKKEKKESSSKKEIKIEKNPQNEAPSFAIPKIPNKRILFFGKQTKDDESPPKDQIVNPETNVIEENKNTETNIKKIVENDSQSNAKFELSLEVTNQMTDVSKKLDENIEKKLDKKLNEKFDEKLDESIKEKFLKYISDLIQDSPKKIDSAEKKKNYPHKNTQESDGQITYESLKKKLFKYMNKKKNNNKVKSFKKLKKKIKKMNNKDLENILKKNKEKVGNNQPKISKNKDLTHQNFIDILVNNISSIHQSQSSINSKISMDEEEKSNTKNVLKDLNPITKDKQD